MVPPDLTTDLRISWEIPFLCRYSHLTQVARKFHGMAKAHLINVK